MSFKRRRITMKYADRLIEQHNARHGTRYRRDSCYENSHRVVEVVNEDGGVRQVGGLHGYFKTPREALIDAGVSLYLEENREEVTA